MESNKTQILSFDDALSNHKKVLTESLVNFNEGHRVRKIMLDIDSNSADYEYYFQSGQQSKQAKVDELQKRIDLALNKSEDFYDFGDGESAMAFCSEIINILKGERNE